MTTEDTGSGSSGDETLERLVDGFSEPVVPQVSTANPEEAALAREFVETFGLLAYDNEPVEPSNTARSELLRATTGGVERIQPSIGKDAARSSSKWGSWGLLRYLSDSNPRWDTVLRLREGPDG